MRPRTLQHLEMRSSRQIQQRKLRRSGQGGRQTTLRKKKLGKRGGEVVRWKISVSSFQFCCDPRTVLKEIKFIF